MCGVPRARCCCVAAPQASARRIGAPTALLLQLTRLALRRPSLPPGSEHTQAALTHPPMRVCSVSWAS